MARLLYGPQERGEIACSAGGGEHALGALGRRPPVGREEPRGDEQTGEQVVLGAETHGQQPDAGQLGDRFAEVGGEAGPLAQLQLMDDKLAVDQADAL